MTWMTNHESIHIVMGDNANSTDRRFRSMFFGKVLPTSEDPVSMLYSSLTSPRHYSTRWFHEGIATFMETWMAGGLGRALGGYDEMAFRAMVRDDAYIYDVVGLESEGSTVDFQTGANSYLYGTRFMTWLCYQYGPDKLLEWITRGENTKRYFASRFHQVYGESLETAWLKWIADERRWQENNLQTIRQYPVTRPEHISQRALGSVSRAYYDAADKVLYAAVRYPGTMAEVAAIHTDTGAIEHLKDIKGPGLYYVTSLAYDPTDRKLYYTTDNNNLRDLNVYDVETRHAHRLLKDFRTGDLAFDKADQSLWGVRHNNGLSSLVYIPGPYTEFKQVHEFEYGSDCFDIDVSPDGKYLTAALTDLSGRQKLVRFETQKLRAGDASFEVLYDFDYNSPGNFVYSPDGRYLYGSSYYTGASNLFRYDNTTKKMDVISNAETGLFRPVPLPDGRLIGFEYTSKGFVPSYVPGKPVEDVAAVKYLGMALLEKYPVLRSWKLPPPSSVNSANLITQAGLYNPIRNVRLISGYPVIQGYKSTVAGGMRFDFADKLRIATLSLTGTFSPGQGLPAKEKPHFEFDSHLWNWHLTGYWNNADFYDLFGPVQVSRKGYGAKLDHAHYLLYDTPRTLQLDWNIAQYGGFDRLPEYQNVVATFHSLMEANAGLKYSFLERSQGAVDDERGTEWGLYTRLNYAGGDALPRIWATYNKGFLLPKNSSFWLRSSTGKSWGNVNNPFANFYFGAFNNNYIDYRPSDQYRDYYSFPGTQIDAISATSFGKLMGEYDLPPLRFRRVGSTWLYANWARFSIFSAGLGTNLGVPSVRDFYVDAGTQLDVRLVLFTYLNTTFSAGYAGAADKNGHITGEYIVSLKIL